MGGGTHHSRRRHPEACTASSPPPGQAQRGRSCPAAMRVKLRSPQLKREEEMLVVSTAFTFIHFHIAGSINIRKQNLNLAFKIYVLLILCHGADFWFTCRSGSFRLTTECFHLCLYLTPSALCRLDAAC